MKVGPVEVIICAFRRPEVDAAVVEALGGAVKSGAVAVLDLVLLTRDQDSVVHLRDLEAQPQADWSDMIVDPRPLTLLSDTDLEVAAESIGNNETALVAVLEHRWAQRLTNAVQKSGAVTTLYARIPNETVVTALKADGFTAMTFTRSGLPGLLGKIERAAALSGAARVTAGPFQARNSPFRGKDQPTSIIPSATPASREWLADQLEKLADLHAAKVLTNEEFATAKARLLR